MERMSTLCHIERDGKYLMLHRTVKKHDVNKDKWIGVGGHFEADESPEECLLREVREETGYTLTSWQFRGLVTFVSGTGVTEYMCLYTADGFQGEPIACDEGELEWVEKEAVLDLNIWEGDKIFFRLMEESDRFFSLKLVYDGKDRLVSAALDGIPMELFDVLTEDGEKTGVVRERGVAHRDGSPHGTAHVWVVRTDGQGAPEILLQKRSERQESYPGCLGVSAAGHMAAGESEKEAALRELWEELGVSASAEDLAFVGTGKNRCDTVFHGKPFRDFEISHIFVYRKPVDESALCLQPEEVDGVVWMNLDDCIRRTKSGETACCVPVEELELLREFC